MPDSFTALINFWGAGAIYPPRTLTSCVVGRVGPNDLKNYMPKIDERDLMLIIAQFLRTIPIIYVVLCSKLVKGPIYQLKTSF